MSSYGFVVSIATMLALACIFIGGLLSLAYLCVFLAANIRFAFALLAVGLVLLGIIFQFTEDSV